MRNTAGQPVTQADSHGQPGQTVRSGGRQTAARAALMAQLRNREGTAPAQPGSVSTGPANLIPTAEVGHVPAPASELPTEICDSSQRRVSSNDDDVLYDPSEDDVSNSREEVTHPPDTLARPPESFEEYEAHWNAWAQAGGAAGGNRTEAVNRMKAWLTSGDTWEELDLSGLGLTSLPARLPDQLRDFDVSRNRLTSLPDPLPNTLIWLDANENQLTSLPENITTLGRNTEIWVEHNPLSPRVIDSRSSIVNAAGYRGPRIHFPRVTSAPAGVARSLADAVVDWFEAADQEAVRQTWSAFSDEAGRDAFAGFLDRLGETRNAGYPQFKQATAEWLSHLAKPENEKLRNATFQISEGATESCQDRVSLTFNEMKKARLAADVGSGAYDERLPDLIDVARGMFRLDKLETIAREKAASLRLVDEIEVYLAYQVKLREPLNLPLDTRKMCFFRYSGVTQDDLNAAQERVRSEEANEFPDYFSTDWAPWQSAVKRLDPVGYESAQKKLHEAAGTTFRDRLNERLKELGLENDSDAERTLGVSVQAEIAREIKGELTRTFLQARNLSDRMYSAPPLKRKWDVANGE